MMTKRDSATLKHWDAARSPVAVVNCPAVWFSSYAEFASYRRENETLLKTRWQHERSFSTDKISIEIDGTCGICLREMSFQANTAGGDTTEKGRVPNWREELRCGCHFALINRERSLLQHLLSSRALVGWSRVMAIGDTGRVGAFIRSLCGDLVYFDDRVESGLEQLSGSTHRIHLVVASDSMAVSSTRLEVLSAIGSVLIDGGRFVFTAPFDSSEPVMGRDVEAGFDWHLIERLVKSGFRSARVGLYWSEEMGYLGPLNLLVEACR